MARSGGVEVQAAAAAAPGLGETDQIMFLDKPMGYICSFGDYKKGTPEVTNSVGATVSAGRRGVGFEA